MEVPQRSPSRNRLSPGIEDSGVDDANRLEQVGQRPAQDLPVAKVDMQRQPGLGLDLRFDLAERLLPGKVVLAFDGETGHQQPQEQGNADDQCIDFTRDAHVISVRDVPMIRDFPPTFRGVSRIVLPPTWRWHSIFALFCQ